jgi:hypothetical protein
MSITLKIPEFLVNGYFWSGVGAASLFWFLLVYVVLNNVGSILSDILSSWFRR